MMNTIVLIVSVSASLVVIAGGIWSMVRAIWKGVNTLERVIEKVDDHERRLALLEGRNPAHVRKAHRDTWR